MHDQVVLPTAFASLSIFRNIFIRERIEIVHGHSAFSTLAHEGILIGRLLGLKVIQNCFDNETPMFHFSFFIPQAVFTDHSLNGFADISAILTNKLLEITLSGCNHCICVSHTGYQTKQFGIDLLENAIHVDKFSSRKENTVLRAKVPADQVSVIPNATDTTLFKPDVSKRDKDRSIIL